MANQILRAPTGFYILFSGFDEASQAKFLDGSKLHGTLISLTLKTDHVKARPEAVLPAQAKKGWQMMTIGKKRVLPSSKRTPTPSVESELSEAEAEPETQMETEAQPEPEAKPEPKAEVEGPVEIPVIGKKRPGTAKFKKGKKARIESPAPLVEPLPPPEPEVAEIILKKPKAKPKKAGPLDKLVFDGVIEDEEDAYWLSQALHLEEATFSDDEEILLPEDHPLHHTSGSWRAQGLRKVPPALKSSYLPQRNRAQAAAEAASAHSLTTGRTARVTGRRLAHDMETHRKITTTAESDLFAFNQLRIRKKQLRFARSAIEGYGLYAMETIQPGEMVCEYVGELIRSAIADLREAKYLKQGIGSSYLFRIDGDVVCDATFRGSVR